MKHNARVLGMTAALAALAGCSVQSQQTAGIDAGRPAPMRLSALGGAPEAPAASVTAPPIDLTDGSVAQVSFAEMEIIDTRTFPKQIDVTPGDGKRRVKEILPPHTRPAKIKPDIAGEVVGAVLEEARTIPDAKFPGIAATPWTPPDPTLAVGPGHIVSTVNMDIAWYTKSGTLQFQSRLDNTGSPGFFEGVGAGGFTFDPKCFYDHYSGRFIVLALEVYDPNQAWCTFAVSDDSDPNGVWYKYRTNAVVTVGSDTFWVDYPGFGYDQDAYYITGNLFGLNNGGFAGAFFRVLPKAPLLTGGTAVIKDLRDGNTYSVQAAQTFGTAQAQYFVTDESTTQMRIIAVRNALTTPTLSTTFVTVPSFAYPSSGAPNQGGGTADVLDGRIMNVHWRNGKLYAGHGVRISSKNQARWYEFNTNNWPTSGSVTLNQSGNVDGGSGVHTWFPALYSNKFGDVGIVMARSSSTTYCNVAYTGRKATDAAGTMGALQQAAIGNATASGRWGDYFDIAIDPVNEATFWLIGEYQTGGGWGTWISSFNISYCPADLNKDGFVNGDDYDLFADAFDAGLPAADFDKNGFVNGDDYDAFASAFDAGC